MLARNQARTNLHRMLRKLITTAAAVAAIGMVAGMVAFSASAQTATAAPAKWEDVTAAAKKEGRVVLYTATPVPVAQRIVAGFKAAHPEIEIEFIRGNSGDLLPRLEQERNAGVDGADVFISTEKTWFLTRAKEGRLLKPVGPAATAWPADFIENDTVVISGLEPIGLPYSTSQVKTPPEDWADLLKPEFKGKIGLSELASTFVVAWYDWLEKREGSDYLVKLKAQNPKLYAAGPAIAQSISSGEIAIGDFGNTSSITPLIDQGAPIAYGVPKGALGFQYLMAAMGWAKRPNAALVLIDYLMSREGQSAWHSKKDSASPLPNIPGSLDATKITSWNPADYPPDVVANYTKHWNAIFK